MLALFTHVFISTILNLESDFKKKKKTRDPRDICFVRINFWPCFFFYLPVELKSALREVPLSYVRLRLNVVLTVVVVVVVWFP